MTAEAGHQPNRWYGASDGSLHLNGAKLFDANENQLADGSGNMTIGALLKSVPQLISVTTAVTITSSVVTCSGTTTAPVLPAVATCGVVFIKNLGSGNCVIAADAGSDIMAAGSGTGASSLTLATNTQACLVSDGTNWNRIA